MLPIRKSTWAGMGKNLGLGSEKPTTNCLSQQGQKEQQEGGMQGDPKFTKYETQRSNSLGRQFRILPNTREYSSSVIVTTSTNTMKLRHTVQLTTIINFIIPF